MYALPVWHFLSLQEHFGSCLPAPLCLAGETKSGIWKRKECRDNLGEEKMSGTSGGGGGEISSPNGECKLMPGCTCK